jgi:hypothetical protein
MRLGMGKDTLARPGIVLLRNIALALSVGAAEADVAAGAAGTR